MARAKPDTSWWGDAVGPSDPPGVFLFCRETVDPAHQFHARMFAPAMGITEDPATGSAVAAFAGVIAGSLGAGSAMRRHNGGRVRVERKDARRQAPFARRLLDFTH